MTEQESGMTSIRESAMNCHAKWLRRAAEEIRTEGHAGWGNTCEQAADAIDSLNREIDHLLESNAEYQGENAALRRLRRELSAEIRGLQKRVDGELRIKSEFLSSRQCPDHSGKWPRGRCLQCEIESMRGEVERYQELRDACEAMTFADAVAGAEAWGRMQTALRALAQSNDTPD